MVGGAAVSDLRGSMTASLCGRFQHICVSPHHHLRRNTWTYNVTEPVAGNFYPVTTTAALPAVANGTGIGTTGAGGGGEGAAGGPRLSVLVDRAQVRGYLPFAELTLIARDVFLSGAMELVR